jgi:hypothetical protein
MSPEDTSEFQTLSAPSLKRSLQRWDRKRPEKALLPAVHLSHSSDYRVILDGARVESTTVGLEVAFEQSKRQIS